MFSRSCTLAFSAMLMIACLGAPVLAGEKPPRTIVMTGEGMVSAMPDEAVVSAEVVTEAKAAGSAVDANSEILNRAIDSLKQLQVNTSAIRTTGFSLEPQYPPYDEKNPQPHVIIGYEASNGISVTLDDIARAGAVLDALIEAGANRSVGVSFAIKNLRPLMQEARAEAAKDALERAEIYTKSVGTELGPVLSIKEGYASPVSTGMPVEAVVVTAERKTTPVQAGEQSVSATVTIIWALK